MAFAQRVSAALYGQAQQPSDAKLTGELTEDERHEIELHENIHRKDLTQAEIAKQMVRAADLVRERSSKMRDELSATTADNSKPKSPGRPKNPTSEPMPNGSVLIKVSGVLQTLLSMMGRR